MSARCTSCGALIIWAVTKNGKPMPVDAVSAPTGNIALVPDPDPREPPTAQYLKTPGVRYLSHFATCPNAAEHRKARP